MVEESSTYIINITKLADPEDVKNDNFGSWSHSGSHPTTYKVHVNKDGYVNVEKCAPGASGADVVYLRRLHSVHPSNNQFKRLIAFVSGKLLMYHAGVDILTLITTWLSSTYCEPMPY